MREDYPVFVYWQETLDWILDRVEGFPKSVRFTLSSRIVNLSLDVLEKIIEAIYTKQRGAILDRINLDLEKLRVLFRIGFNRKYIAMNQYEHISVRLNDTGKMIGGWKKEQK